jgi:hypothetical protein
MAATNDLLNQKDPEAAATRFASAGNNIHLVGSAAVLVSLGTYLESIAAPDGRNRHDELLTELLRDIRYGLGLSWGLPLAFRMKFRSSRTAAQLRRYAACSCRGNQEVRRDMESFAELAHHGHAQLALTIQHLTYPACSSQKWHEIRPRKSMLIH